MNWLRCSGVLLGGLMAAACPSDDGGGVTTGGNDESSTATPGTTLPDPPATTTTPDPDGSGTTAAPPGDSSGVGTSGSETGEPPGTGSESGSESSGGGNSATPCQGAHVVDTPDVTRVAMGLPSAAPSGVGNLQDDVDPVEGGGSSGSDGGFIGFIDPPDGGTVQFECDIFAQDCPEGEKCMPWSNDGGPAWNATRCSPIAANPGSPGDPCTVEGSGVSGIDDCDIAAMCWNVDDNGDGTCIEMCSGSADAPVCDTPGTACVITNQGALAICQAVCNPLATECAGSEGCYLVGELTVCAPDASGMQGAAGDPCEFINACDDGLSCTGAAAVPGCGGAVGCCSPFCMIGDDSTCLPGQTCVPVYEDGLAPLECVEQLGLCAAP